MSFIGVPIVKQVSDALVRITGVSLDGSGEIGTIGLHENNYGADVRLPQGFKPRPYDLPDFDGDVTLVESVQATFNFMNHNNPVQIDVDKSGTTPETFRIKFTNNAVDNSGPLEIYVRFH